MTVREFNWYVASLPEDSMLRAAIKETPKEVSSPEQVASYRKRALGG